MADIKINGATPSAFYFGSTAATAVYYGSTKLWEASSPTPTTKEYCIQFQVTQNDNFAATTLQMYSLSGYTNDTANTTNVTECKGRANSTADWASITGDPCSSDPALGLSQATTLRQFGGGFQVFCTVPADTNKFSFVINQSNGAPSVSTRVYEANNGVIGDPVSSSVNSTVSKTASTPITVTFTGT